MHLGQYALRSLALLAILPLAACDEDPPTTAPSLYVSSSNTAAVRSEFGLPGTTLISVSNPSGGPVTLSLSGVPQGLNATLSATTLAPGVDTTTLTVEPTLDLPPGNYVLNLTATSGGESNTHRVAVFVPTPGITIIPAWAGFEVGDAPRQAGIQRVALPNSNVTWQSADPSIVSVSATGVFTPGVAGTTMVRAISQVDNRFTDSVQVVVRAPTTWTEIQLGTPVTGLSGGDLFFRVNVPRGPTRLTITTSGSGGAGQDVDIYVWRNQSPGPFTTAALACFGEAAGNNETCTVNNPAGGMYYIYLAQWTPWSNVTLLATVTMP